jgi:hypothetical protein
MPRSYSLTFEKSLDSLGDPQVATLLSIVEPENPNRAALGPSMLDRLGKGHDWGPWGNRLCSDPLVKNLDYWYDFCSECFQADGVKVKNSNGKKIKGRKLHILCDAAGDPGRNHDKSRQPKETTAYTKLCNCTWRLSLTAIYSTVRVSMPSDVSFRSAYLHAFYNACRQGAIQSMQVSTSLLSLLPMKGTSLPSVHLMTPRSIGKQSRKVMRSGTGSSTRPSTRGPSTTCVLPRSITRW